jgi:hypothetical protein
MISSSKDIFYLVLSLAILWLTFFSCWLLYYFITLLYEVRNSFKELQEKMRHFSEFINQFKDRVEHSVAIFAVIGEAMKQLVSYFLEKKERRKNKTDKRDNLV